MSTDSNPAAICRDLDTKETALFTFAWLLVTIASVQGASFELTKLQMQFSSEFLVKKKPNTTKKSRSTTVPPSPSALVGKFVLLPCSENWSPGQRVKPVLTGSQCLSWGLLSREGQISSNSELRNSWRGSLEVIGKEAMASFEG